MSNTAHHSRDFVLKIADLTVKLSGKLILNRLSLQINPGDVVVVMGPNGAGKSTLAKAIMGLTKYSGDLIWQISAKDTSTSHANNEQKTISLKQDPPHTRSRLGIFLSFQEPPAVPGVTVSDFLRAVTPNNLSLADFYQKLSTNLELVGLPEDYADRELGVGFSGGEKKKLEMLQLLMLNPRLAIFDEIDSGLDVDAVRVIAKAFKKWYSKDKSTIIITHNSRLIKRLKPNKVIILKHGKIAKSDNYELAKKTLKEGFSGEAQ